MIYTSNIGFPRIGERRELKKIVESYWKNEISSEELLKNINDIKKYNYLIQKEKGIDIIPSNDFSLYDHVLDQSIMLRHIPERYLQFGKPDSLEVYFAMARGKGYIQALEMTKWFDTNYHYIVPEIPDGGSIKSDGGRINGNRPLKEYLWAKNELRLETKPTIIGLYTYLKLCKIKDEKIFKQRLASISDSYKQILNELSKEKVKYIQIEEPALVLAEDPSIVGLTGEIYSEIAKEKSGSKWILATYFEDVSEYFSTVANFPFDYIGLDLIRSEKNLEILKTRSLPESKRFALGIVDGRNVWKSDIQKILNTLKVLDKEGLLEEAIIQPSCSLLHLPYSTKHEKSMPKEIQESLAFSVEKLEELSTIKKLFLSGKDAPEKKIKSHPRNKRVIDRSNLIKESDFERSKPFAERKVIQSRRLNLPKLPTTTIGSFPQTERLRRTRALWKGKKISGQEYSRFINEEITAVLELQEEIGLDVLVHGEFERTDMVEFFGEKLNGFLFTKNGWVQSYGTRCVKPPLIYSDVERPKAMTVDKITFAQSKTTKPVKGMLTGPVTILNWSFPRIDITREQVAYQIALALRDEVGDLEKNGIKIIQIDEPAIREGLPLKVNKREEYLRWAVRAFKLCSSGVKDETQIHTHMCYSDFNEIIRAIYDMDADVISIENARSSDEILSVFKEFNYDHFIGPGVYDVHSPRVPSVLELKDKIKKIGNHIRKELLWINPDCGLKTRDYPEVKESLKNMVEAAMEIRKTL